MHHRRSLRLRRSRRAIREQPARIPRFTIHYPCTLRTLPYLVHSLRSVMEFGHESGLGCAPCWKPAHTLWYWEMAPFPRARAFPPVPGSQSPRGGTRDKPVVFSHQSTQKPWGHPRQGDPAGEGVPSFCFLARGQGSRCAGTVLGGHTLGMARARRNRQPQHKKHYHGTGQPRGTIPSPTSVHLLSVPNPRTIRTTGDAFEPRTPGGATDRSIWLRGESFSIRSPMVITFCGRSDQPECVRQPDHDGTRRRVKASPSEPREGQDKTRPMAAHRKHLRRHPLPPRLGTVSPQNSRPHRRGRTRKTLIRGILGCSRHPPLPTPTIATPKIWVSESASLPSRTPSTDSSSLIMVRPT